MLMIGASIPDPTLLIKSLDEPTAFARRLDGQAGFRLAQARSDTSLDAVPTKDKILELQSVHHGRVGAPGADGKSW